MPDRWQYRLLQQIIVAKEKDLKHTMRAGCGVETVSGTKRELKEPRDGRFIGSPVVRIIQTRNASGSLVRASVSTPFGSPFTGLFISGPCHGGECMAPLKLEHGQRRYGSGESAINVRAITQPLVRDKQTCPGNTGNAQKFCHARFLARRYLLPQTTDNETAGAADRPSDSPHKARRLIKEWLAQSHG